MNTIKEQRAKFSELLAEELNRCADGDEQRQLLEEFLKVGVGAYTLAFQNAPRRDQEACIADLREYLMKLVDVFRLKLLHR